MVWNRLASVLVPFLTLCAVSATGCSIQPSNQQSIEKIENSRKGALLGELASDTNIPNQEIGATQADDLLVTQPAIDGSLNVKVRKLRVSIRGFSESTGNCRIAVYSDATNFNQPEKAVLRAILPIEAGTSYWEPSEEDLAKLPDEVAIAIFQDVNENEKLDKNSLGIPTERYGFSNNPKRGFGPPSFHQAKYRLSDGINTLTIEIR